jgi:hypothetical protein
MDMSGNFLPHMSVESTSNIPQNPSDVITKVQDPMKTFENTPLVCPKMSSCGGYANFYFDWNPNIFIT